jgi:ABC-type Fe3+ transport system permease subunit
LLDVTQVLFEPNGRVVREVRAVLWNQPSPVPNFWACVLRFLPMAIAILWPMVRLFPRQLEESAALEGLGPGRRLWRLLVPVLCRPLGWAMLGVAVLSLGELSAGKLVATPGFTTFAHQVFMQMHYGTDTELAALCLLLLAMVALGGICFSLTRPGPIFGWNSRNRHH